MRYIPGTWLAITAGESAAILPAGPDAAVVTALAEGLASGGVLGFVDALTAGLGVGVSAMPAFGVVVKEADGYRVAVRGEVIARVPGGEASLDGAGVTGWAEAVWADAATVAVAVGPAADAGAQAWWVERGVVLASRIELGEAVSGAAPAAEAPTAAAEPSAPAAEAPALAAALTPEAPAPVAEAPEAAEPSAPAADVPSAVPEAPVSFTTRYDYQEPEGPAPQPESTPAAEGEAEDDFELNLSFTSLWGATDADLAPPAPASSTPAADVPTFEPAPSAAAAMVPPPSAPASPPPAAPAAPPAPASPPPPAPPTPASAAPAPPPAPPPPPFSPPAGTPLAPAQAGDHDGETVSEEVARSISNSLSKLTPPVAPPVSTAPPGMPVFATPEQVARATRGRAVLSTGPVIELDRNVIIGRLPRAARITGEMPHLVAVPSPQQDISRNHLEIRVEGSTVTVVDLDSTNGSFLHRMGAEPVRLHPNEPTVVVSGDVIDIGDNVTVTLEDLP